MSIYCETHGKGEDLVLLHGWGLNGAVWDDLITPLAEQFCVHVVDLPGHGRSQPLANGYSLQTFSEALAEQMPDRAHWLGWSLGGLIALDFAQRFPQRVTTLSLLCSNAQFVKSETWPTAIEPAVLASFADELTKNYASTLQRFLSLQAMGDPNARKTVRKLRQRLPAHGEPDPAALAGGLQILQSSHMQSVIKAITCPLMMMFARLDSLVPAAAQSAMQNLKPSATTYLFERSAHAPFMTQSEEFVQQLITFIHEPV